MYRNPNVYNVYGEKIDPKNNMPTNPNQLPRADQKAVLSTERVKSGIPKGGTDETWLYPSPQMFWNSLNRKEKADGASEDDMDVIVAIHNNMNEKTWSSVMGWEGLHPPATDNEGKPIPGAEPKLLRFTGRPHDLSPKARIKMLLGYPEPFDRHDWVVDRGGEEVRYVIDYYHDEAKSKEDKIPSLRDYDGVKSILVDVRPALDSPKSFLDRLFRMPLAEIMEEKKDHHPLPLLPTEAMRKATAAAASAAASSSTPPAPVKLVPGPVVDTTPEFKLNMTPVEIKTAWEQMQTGCVGARAKLAECDSDESCSKATIALTYCMAGKACPDVRNRFDSAANMTNSATNATSVAAADLAMQSSYDEMLQCLGAFQHGMKKAGLSEKQ